MNSALANVIRHIIQYGRKRGGGSTSYLKLQEKKTKNSAKGPA